MIETGRRRPLIVSADGCLTPDGSTWENHVIKVHEANGAHVNTLQFDEPFDGIVAGRVDALPVVAVNFGHRTAGDAPRIATFDVQTGENLYSIEEPGAVAAIGGPAGHEILATRNEKTIGFYDGASGDRKGIIRTAERVSGLAIGGASGQKRIVARTGRQIASWNLNVWPQGSITADSHPSAYAENSNPLREPGTPIAAGQDFVAWSEAAPSPDAVMSPPRIQVATIDGSTNIQLTGHVYDEVRNEIVPSGQLLAMAVGGRRYNEVVAASWSNMSDGQPNSTSRLTVHRLPSFRNHHIAGMRLLDFAPTSREGRGIQVRALAAAELAISASLATTAVLAGCRDGVIRAWDAQTKKQLMELRAHNNPITALQVV